MTKANHLKKITEGALKKYLTEVSGYKYAMEESCIMIVSKGVINYANEKFIKISKFSIDELIGKNYHIINLESQTEDVISNIKEILINEKAWHGCLKIKAHDGIHYWLDTAIFPFLDEENTTHQYIAIGADVTERKRAEELISANKELVYQKEEREKRAEELVIAIKELIFQNSEKEKLAAELIIANRELKKAEDDIRKLNEDLEEKVLLRTAQLESANKELDSFSYSISHDLRAPLRAINGYARILKEDYGSQFDGDANRLMNNIMNNAKKMGQLIDDLLTFSRLGRKELLKINIPMQEMVTNICNETKTDQDSHNITFKINDLQIAQGDSVAIKQVWVNLISNAVKYSRLKEKAIIDIGSSVNESDICYYIKDNGVGFDMRYANKLFGVFQRLHSEDKFEGTGVGLAIVHRIISKHGGKVWAEGKVDKGATFHFSLPKNISK